MAEKRSASQRRAEEKAKVEAAEAEQQKSDNNNATESVSSLLGAGGPGSSCSAVEAFYAEAIILVTGATGFLGKALLEKLLRSCSRLSTIFVLIRPKRGRTMEQRFTELIENPVSFGNFSYYYIYIVSGIRVGV